VPTDFDEMSGKIRVSQSHGRLLWFVVGVDMVNPDVWCSRRTAGWTKDGKDVELVMAVVRICCIDVA